jgi:hypothetical protein
LILLLLLAGTAPSALLPTLWPTPVFH